MIENFDKFKKVHFIGIGGIGISAVAQMFLKEGKKVSGSDLSDSMVTETLQDLGAKVSIGASYENISEDTDLVIYTIAVSDDNPEIIEARKRNLPLLTYPETLAIISKNKKTIAITGTHGKTTVTSMIAKVMEDCGFDPTVIVGSFLKEWKSNFLPGKSEYFVVEGCEYRRSFLNLHPYILVINNIEADHLDYYKDLEDIKSAFRELAERVPENGFIVADLSSEIVRDVLSEVKASVINYKDFDLENLKIEKMPGAHNLDNARASLCVVKNLGGEIEEIKNSLQNFGGVWRRFEHKGNTENGAQVYDDYAHHPTEIKAFFFGARDKFTDKKIMAIFQPHMISRTKDFLDDFALSLSLFDKVLILPIFKARDEEDQNISSQDLVNKINEIKYVAGVAEDFSDVKNIVNEIADGDWVVATIGAGKTNLLSEELVI
jgi:UDP-N-acetylmuramate--alanine ligase